MTTLYPKHCGLLAVLLAASGLGCDAEEGNPGADTDTTTAAITAAPAPAAPTRRGAAPKVDVPTTPTAAPSAPVAETPAIAPRVPVAVPVERPPAPAGGRLLGVPEEPWGALELQFAFHGSIQKGIDRSQFSDPLEGRSDEEVLKQVNTAEDPARRDVALLSLANRGNPAALEIASRWMADTGAPLPSRQTALGILTGVGGEAALSAAWAALRDPMPRIRMQAIHELKLWGHDAALKAMTIGLEDPEPEVRWAAADQMTALRKSEDAWPLAERLIKSDDPQILMRVAGALEHVAHPRAGQMLADAVDVHTDKPEARRAFFSSLRQWRVKHPHIVYAMMANKR